MTVIAPHRLDHEFERGIYECASFLGVEVLFQARRIDDVDEQRGDELAFSLGHGLRVFGVRWRCRRGRWRAAALGNISECESAAALIAESGSRAVQLAAFRAAKSQASTAGTAELGPVRILGIAALALHH